MLIPGAVELELRQCYESLSGERVEPTIFELEQYHFSKCLSNERADSRVLNHVYHHPGEIP